MVSSDDVFIIAVNSGRMSYGLSDIDPPRILKALFPLGDEFVRFDTNGNVVHRGLHYPPVVTKASGVQVPTTTFTNPETAGISAVLFSDERIGWRHDPRTHDLSQLGNNMLVIQNRMSRVPLQVGWLGVGCEFYPVGDENLERKEYPGADDYSGANVEGD